MFKRIVFVLALSAVGLALTTNAAWADPAYDPPGLSVTAVNPNQLQLSGSNFGDDSGKGDDQVVVSVRYPGPPALRSGSAFLSAKADYSYTFTPGDAGEFSGSLPILVDGDIYFSAVGYPSGDAVAVVLADPPGVPGSTDGAGADGYASGGYQNSGTGTNGGTNSSTGLAYTGAGIGTPLAIGAAALVAGLALLFFGTRGISRQGRLRSAGARRNGGVPGA